MQFQTGWIPPKDRTDEMLALDAASKAKQPKFATTPKTLAPGEKILMTDLWKHPMVVSKLGFEFPGIYQQTGSCVGAGWGNEIFTLSAIEVIRLGDPEQIFLPFWLITYGRSRFLGGMRGEGEGSFESALTEAALEDGVLDSRYPGLPQYTRKGGIVYSGRTEMSWSNGGAQQTLALLPESRKMLLRSAPQVSEVDDAVSAIANWYPIGFACNKFIDPSTARVRGTGKNAALVGQLRANGGHKTSLLAAWNNPELGMLFGNVNQWSDTAYPQDPGGLPRCAVWMTADDFMYGMRQDGEGFVKSQFNGLPEQSYDIDWSTTG